ncbi:unnamed protein product [Diplocarpon coronariae]|uniref:Uncharacterized protein n=1 Tax=Diplocarpon coronariae TaxID=2795749 RepID=A0A218YS69_9HELO|nr:hypothetical protein B2J93_9419 [Marssonina coronariae]
MDGRRDKLKVLPSQEEVQRIRKALNAGDQFKGLRAWLKENDIAVIAMDKFKGASASREDGSGKRENSPVFTIIFLHLSESPERPNEGPPADRTTYTMFTDGF